MRVPSPSGATMRFQNTVELTSPQLSGFILSKRAFAMRRQLPAGACALSWTVGGGDSLKYDTCGRERQRATGTVSQ